MYARKKVLPVFEIIIESDLAMMEFEIVTVYLRCSFIPNKLRHPEINTAETSRSHFLLKAFIIEDVIIAA